MPKTNQSRQIAPEYSKSRVNLAGKRIRDNFHSANDEKIIENWRASHNYILNTFQANLRSRSSKFNKNVVVAQRLKRRTTIYDKLSRQEAMELARMQDIAGCRMIFDNQNDLNTFRIEFHKTRAKHVLRRQYDYIARPRESGYRGIHDIYEYKTNSQSGSRWNGLLIEIQYRTYWQHAWATAVEIVGSITESQPKFERGDERHREFFRLCSELIAREFEDQHSVHGDLSSAEMRERLNALESEIHLIRTLRGLNLVDADIKEGKHVILIFSEKTQSLEVAVFNDIVKATKKYFELEKEISTDLDIVLVQGITTDSIRIAFKNYFSDARDFVDYIGAELREI